ncbi:AI-2E family transporter [uncultured Azonexus sp.]|uniref:AI-2E family transporter n=1 Tax=uncultured Azonexus sp. TaxID=520307 RepID=UPI0026296D04|nr:AI-2E family transporter [uncultured Azonexus sp.]
MLNDSDTRRLAQIALVVLLIVGCIAVLLPFVGALLFALIIWVCSWESYRDHLLPRLGGRDSLGASLMVVLLIVVLLVPTIFLAGALVSGADHVIELVRPYFEEGLPAEPPAWFAGIPLFADEIIDFWHEVASSREALNALLVQGIAPARELLLAAGAVAANGMLQLALVLFVVFFLYRDGEVVAKALYGGARKLGGELGEGLVDKARGTVFGVMLGIVGTAAAQGSVAMIGFFIAGAPAPVLLGFATFFLSMIPVGPPLVWGGAALWLYGDGQTGWAIFMALYGLFIISSIDNVVKPLLMARGAGLSVLIVALGVFGGVLVFGFIGIFLGPVLLALGHMLLTRWLREESPS